MKKTVLLLLSFIVLIVNVKASQDFLKKITSGHYKSQTITNIIPLADAELYAQITDNGKQILAYSYKKGDVCDTIIDIEKIKGCPIDSIEGFVLDSLEQRVLLYANTEKIYRRSFKADYYVFNRKRNTFDALSENGKQQCAVFSPNGRMVAFVRENNLYIKKLDFNTEIAVTKDGEYGKIINGISDWVYEEEFGKTQMFSWSPDSKLLAFVRLDESDVKTFSFQWFGGEQLLDDGYPVVQTYKYPRAGTKNAKPTLHVYDVFYKSTKTLDLGEIDVYVPKIAWGLTSDVLFAFRLNRNQNQLDMFAFNPRSTVGKITLTERSEKYYVDYNNLKAFEVLPNNRIVWMSEADGYCHLYLYNWKNGQKLQQITSGKWDVTDYYGTDVANKVFFYQSTESSSLERKIYSIDLKGKKKCLTTESGTHTALFNAKNTYFIDEFSSLEQPSIYNVVNTVGAKIRVIKDNATLRTDFEQNDLPEKEFFSFTTNEGVELNGWMLKPTDFDQSKKYPVLMVQYSGPASQEVRNRWSINWEYYLAKNGYMVVCVDGRGTGARGEAFRKCTYRNLGEKEVDDQIATAQYISTLPFVDASRIGIWGWSYGGYMVLSCMINGDGIFKTGIAVAPVTDWKLYDSAYTERFMRRPQENFKGYESSSLLDKAKNLKGNLLLVHGTADDNVHLQNTMLFSEELINAGVQFDMMLYPNKNHSILGNDTRLHLYTKMSQFLFKNL